jgi:hypothetical protein
MITPKSTMHRCLCLVALLLGSKSIFGSAFATFQQPCQRKEQRKQQQQQHSPAVVFVGSLSGTENDDRENWTYNPFDVDDLSPLDTLLRRGIVPLGIRLLRSEKYEQAVLDYMRKEGCDRATAQRNMDAFFNDPNGWIVSYGRKRDLGEDFGDINAPTGVQKRPVFSFLWGYFCVWLFFVFFPTRIEELGGIQPSSFGTNGVCLYQKRTADGALYCEEGAKGFEKSAMDYLDREAGPTK